MSELKRDENGYPIPETGEIIPGMTEQGKGIKCYVHSEYAPLKACLVGNPSGGWMPNGETWEYANMFTNLSDEFQAYIKKYGGTNLKETDPETYEKMAMESDALAAAYRKAGVKIIRNETGHTPDDLINYNYQWSKQKQFTLFGASAFEVFGHCLVELWESTNSNIAELTHREAINEIFRNDKDAVWLTMPPHFPNVNRPYPGPFVSPGDPRIFDKMVLLGIGVPDPSHVNDLNKPRSSGDEWGAEILRRMLKPFGWRVETVYFDSRLSYHIDCVMSVLDEGLLACKKGALWTELPKELQDWEMLEISPEDQKLGIANNVPLGNKKLICHAGTKKFAKDMEKRGWELFEVPYSTIYGKIGSGVHCSTASIWREFD